MNKKELLKKYTRNAPIKWKQGFSMLPTELLMNPQLSRSCLVVFWVLTVHLFRGKQFCFPSLKTISEEAHSSVPTVIKAIKELNLKDKSDNYAFIRIKKMLENPFYCGYIQYRGIWKKGIHEPIILLEEFLKIRGNEKWKKLIE